MFYDSNILRPCAARPYLHGDWRLTEVRGEVSLKPKRALRSMLVTGTADAVTSLYPSRPRPAEPGPDLQNRAQPGRTGPRPAEPGSARQNRAQTCRTGPSAAHGALIHGPRGKGELRHRPVTQQQGGGISPRTDGGTRRRSRPRQGRSAARLKPRAGGGTSSTAKLSVRPIDTTAASILSRQPPPRQSHGLQHRLTAEKAYVQAPERRKNTRSGLGYASCYWSRCYTAH